MKFGFMGWLQLPKPWDADSEYRIWNDGLEEIELCDRIGIDHLWEIEHHFLEEYSHSSAGESFLAACSQRTKRIRLGSGICLLPPNYNHPARVAERVAALDLMSNGRAEFGTGESTSFTELDAFHVSRAEKRAQWRESLGVVCRMMVEEPFRGAQGKYFNMPPRNVIPKPRQKPHPPVWVACSRQETIMTAAKFGIGALTFGFVSAEDARNWTASYYRVLADAVPLTYRVTPNVGFLMTTVCDRNGDRARRMAEENAFGLSGRHYYVDGTHKPGRTDLWAMQQAMPPEQRLNPFANAVGTPDEVRKVMLARLHLRVAGVVRQGSAARIRRAPRPTGKGKGRAPSAGYRDRDEAPRRAANALVQRRIQLQGRRLDGPTLGLQSRTDGRNGQEGDATSRQRPDHRPK
jgi:alkanesulfonate monooxygenase SsuD/methylene tetrahydromethanopterin reductase-like flavin-dependent oxidoreductase (luciferase family)